MVVVDGDFDVLYHARSLPHIVQSGCFALAHPAIVRPGDYRTMSLTPVPFQIQSSPCYGIPIFDVVGVVVVSARSCSRDDNPNIPARIGDEMRIGYFFFFFFSIFCASSSSHVMVQTSQSPLLLNQASRLQTTVVGASFSYLSDNHNRLIVLEINDLMVPHSHQKHDECAPGNPEGCRIILLPIRRLRLDAQSAFYPVSSPGQVYVLRGVHSGQGQSTNQSIKHRQGLSTIFRCDLGQSGTSLFLAVLRTPDSAPYCNNKKSRRSPVVESQDSEHRAEHTGDDGDGIERG
jgi:hypothetical protein